jgi:hypothetical protein
MQRYVVHCLGDDRRMYWHGFVEKSRADEFFNSLGRTLREYYLEDITWEEGQTNFVAAEIERYWPPTK